MAFTLHNKCGNKYACADTGKNFPTQYFPSQKTAMQDKNISRC